MTTRINITLSEQLLEDAKSSASKLGITLSEYIRLLIIKNKEQ